MENQGMVSLGKYAQMVRFPPRSLEFSECLDSMLVMAAAKHLLNANRISDLPLKNADCLPNTELGWGHSPRWKQEDLVPKHPSENPQWIVKWHP